MPDLSSLIARYDRPGPRYTSYPSAAEFGPGVDADRYRVHLDRAAARRGAPLSLYVHLPFCAERCLFCGCSAVVTKHRERALPYLDALEREIDRVGDVLGEHRPVAQYHWGGGTPTYLAPAEMRRLHERIASRFSFLPGAERSVEIDPRVTTPEHLETLRELGFDRVSMGVQDFTPAVQAAIGRIQPLEQTRELVGVARSLGFASVNLDLIYGLPFQTPESFKVTLEQAGRLRPDRFAIYGYAHVPWIRPHQNKMDAEALPDAPGRLALFNLALRFLGRNGYRAIGMDHFALPDDELSVAADDGRLWRNFMGYTVGRADDLIGLGMSAISDVADGFFQNEKRLIDYERRAGTGRYATSGGYLLTESDRLRRHVITALMCRFRVDIREVEERFGVRFGEIFEAELAQLAPFEGDGLVCCTPHAIQVTPKGRLFVRNLCMVFDEHLGKSRNKGTRRFSRTV